MFLVADVFIHYHCEVMPISTTFKVATLATLFCPCLLLVTSTGHHNINGEVY